MPQDDIIHRELPVGQALRYAAQLRLPRDTSEGEIDSRIERVLTEVEMDEQVERIIGRLSGGQRKRVSIGVELLAEPGVLFLDEATSCLDPGLEKKPMHTLRRLVDGGRTVVFWSRTPRPTSSNAITSRSWARAAAWCSSARPIGPWTSSV